MSDKAEFSPELADDLATRAANVSLNAERVDFAGACIDAEQFFRLGALALQQAERFFTMAGLAQARARVGRL